MAPSAESSIVFNIVWTGTVFTYLRPFVETQLAHTDARFRFVVNACPPEQIALMEAFAAQRPDRIVEVLEVSSDVMITHGAALDRVRTQRDDGEWFALIDSDILVKGPFLGDFVAKLDAGVDVVSSARGIWSETDVIPDGHVGVDGQYFFNADGFVFGGPHFAIYRRAVVDATADRWDIGFGSGGPDIPAPAVNRLEEGNLRYWIYDTAKVMNALIQLDGGTLIHEEHPMLLHIGGVSHYLSPPESIGSAKDQAIHPEWAAWDSDRLEVAQFCAAVLMAMVDGGEPAAVPSGVEPAIASKLGVVRAALIEMVERYG